MSYDQPPAQECTNHPGYDAVGYCPLCGLPLCEACLAAHQQDPPRYCPGPPQPAKEPRNPMATVLGVVVGVLVLCLLGLVIAAVVYFRSTPPAPPEATNALEIPGSLPGLPPPDGLTPPPAPPLIPPEPPPAPPDVPPSGSAREEAAKTVALQDKPGWVAVINWRKPDWSEVRIWIGPTKHDLRLSRSLAWDPSLRAYIIMDEGAIPRPPSTTVPPAPAAGGPQPGKQAAQDAALANDPGYVATIVKRSTDWKQVTVHTGPRLKPLANEYRFHWDDNVKQYVLDHMGPIGKGRGTPPGE